MRSSRNPMYGLDDGGTYNKNGGDGVHYPDFHRLEGWSWVEREEKSEGEKHRCIYKRHRTDRPQTSDSITGRRKFEWWYG